MCAHNFISQSHTKSALIFAERILTMKKTLTLFLILCALMLTACTRKDATVITPTSSPTSQATNTPEMPLTMPSESSQPVQGSAVLKDGVYQAEVSDAYVQGEGHGWKDYLKMTVVNGQVSNIEFDALKDGKKKSEATSEEYPMTPSPSEWIPQLNESLLAAQLPEAVDTISGATNSSRVARELYAAALNAAQAGNTIPVTVDIK